MQTRSKGNQNLLRYLDNIDLLPRELREQRDRIRFEEEDQVNMEDTTPAEMHDGVPTIPRHQVRRPRYIGAGDTPSIHTPRHGIIPPAFPNNDFEIKSGIITMVQNQKFHGLPDEDPLDHLDDFERLCGLTKLNGLSEDALKLRLFPFSLGDKARIWEKHLPPRSITSWAECKTAFLTKFFSNSRTSKLRNAIYGFKQLSSETFSEAWERFNTYQSQCPHHGFSTESLLCILYRGVLPMIRILLDTASNGNFLNKDVDDGWELVENLAQADSQYGEDYDITVRGPTDSDMVSKKEIKALNEKLDKLLSINKKQVHMIGEREIVQDEEEAQIEEVYFIQNQGAYMQYNNYTKLPNLSYRSTNVAYPHDPIQQSQPQQVQTQAYVPQQTEQQQPEVMALLQQLLQGQTATTTDFSKKLAAVHVKIDAFHIELNRKFETLNARLKNVENQQASSFVQTTLPEQTNQNHKEYTVQSITLRSDNELTPRARHCKFTEDSAVQEGEAFLTRNQAEKLTPPTQVVKLDHLTRPTPGRVQPPKSQTLAVSRERSKVSAPLSYKVQLPFPRRVMKDMAEKYKFPQVVLVTSGKASDYCRRAPRYEEVIDGKSFETLFACNETAQPPLKELCKLPKLDLGPDIVLQPNGYVDGMMEYKVKSSKRPKPFAKVKQLLFPTKPKSDWSGPFSIKKFMPCGAITLVSKEGDDLPKHGQKVNLYMVAGTTSERTPPPLSEPP